MSQYSEALQRIADKDEVSVDDLVRYYELLAVESTGTDSVGAQRVLKVSMNTIKALEKINAAIEVLKNLQRHDLAYCDPRDDERDMLPVMDGQWFEAEEALKALEILKGKDDD